MLFRTIATIGQGTPAMETHSGLEGEGRGSQHAMGKWGSTAREQGPVGGWKMTKEETSGGVVWMLAKPTPLGVGER